MKIIVTERQSKLLTSADLDEQESDDSPVEYPEYPEVGKWETGLTRGPGNQLDPKSKWSDVVGSNISRGKANPIK